MTINHAIINGLKVYAPNSPDELIDYAVKRKALLVAVNAEKITSDNVQLRNIINLNVGYPDGVGATIALRRCGLNKAIKIPGCELWLMIIKKHYANKTFYLIGSTQVVIEKAVRNLKNDFPGINIVNYRNGYINSTDERNEVINDICMKKPDFVFVAMGTPKQELFMHVAYQKHNAVYQGLGGSFDIYAGILKRAPKWMINLRLEWAYRLAKEPSRWRRQLYLLVFIVKVIFKRF